MLVNGSGTGDGGRRAREREESEFLFAFSFGECSTCNVIMHLLAFRIEENSFASGARGVQSLAADSDRGASSVRSSVFSVLDGDVHLLFARPR